MLDDLYEDAELFREFPSLTPSLESSARAIESVRQAILSHAALGKTEQGRPAVAVRTARTPSSGARHAWPTVVMFAIAATLVMALVAAGIMTATRSRIDSGLSANRSAGGQTAFPEASPAEFGTSLPMAPKSTLKIISLVADDAPVLVANGENKPIALGSTTQHVGGRLHVWDWTKDQIGRQLPGVELWPNERLAISADGKWLVWARGQIVNLQTGEKAQIDLGGADYESSGGTYQRIGDMRFSPDGRKLALHITEHDRDRPGLIERQLVQIVAFPSGRALCEFPTADSYRLTISFSKDSEQLVSIEGHKVVRRDADSAKVLQEYVSPSQTRLIAVALSPAGQYIAAIDEQTGALHLWDTETGRLTSAVTQGELEKAGGHHTALDRMCFSSDEQYLAAAYWGRLLVIDAGSGAVRAALKDSLAMSLQWSADNRLLTVVTSVSVSRAADGQELNRYPSIHLWDWQNNRRIETSTRGTR